MPQADRVSRMVQSERSYHRLVGKETRKFFRILFWGAVVFFILFSFVVAVSFALKGNLSLFGLRTLWAALQDFAVPQSLNGQLILALVIGGLSFLGISIRAREDSRAATSYRHSDAPQCNACSGLEETRERYLSGDFQVGFAVGLAAVFWVIVVVIFGSIGWGQTGNLVEVIVLIFLAFFVLVVVFQFARISLTHPALYPGAIFAALTEFNNRSEQIQNWVTARSEEQFNVQLRRLRLQVFWAYGTVGGLWVASVLLGFAALPDHYDFASLYGALLAALFGWGFLRSTYTRRRRGRPLRLLKRPVALLGAAGAVLFLLSYITLIVTYAYPGWVGWLAPVWMVSIAVTGLAALGLFNRGPWKFLAASAALQFAATARRGEFSGESEMLETGKLQGVVGVIPTQTIPDRSPFPVGLHYWDELRPWLNKPEVEQQASIRPGHPVARLFTTGTPVSITLDSDAESWQEGCYTVLDDDVLNCKVVVVLPEETTPPLNPTRQSASLGGAKPV